MVHPVARKGTATFPRGYGVATFHRELRRLPPGMSGTFQNESSEFELLRSACSITLRVLTQLRTTSAAPTNSGAAIDHAGHVSCRRRPASTACLPPPPIANGHHDDEQWSGAAIGNDGRVSRCRRPTTRTVCSRKWPQRRRNSSAAADHSSHISCRRRPQLPAYQPPSRTRTLMSRDVRLLKTSSVMDGRPRIAGVSKTRTGCPGLGQSRTGIV
jgi:hypothetical protein